MKKFEKTLIIGASKLLESFEFISELTKDLTDEEHEIFSNKYPFSECFKEQTLKVGNWVNELQLEALEPKKMFSTYVFPEDRHSIQVQNSPFDSRAMVYNAYDLCKLQLELTLKYGDMEYVERHGGAVIEFPHLQKRDEEYKKMKGDILNFWKAC